jgi:hypothetical protein
LLPPVCGRPIRVELRRSLGPHLASTSIPRRVILLDHEVLSKTGEFERILVHEVFHFVWVRLSNANRRSWERVLHKELRGRVAGELGWSAEWRKQNLTRFDIAHRSPTWRRYACESFCDSAAWLFSGLARHDEFTLAAGPRRVRRQWFHAAFPGTSAIPI